MSHRTSLRDLAHGQPCMVRLIGVCNHDPATTVLAHIRRGNVAGMAQKPPDTCAVWACNACHDVIDGRVPYKLDLSCLTRKQLEETVLQLSVDSDALAALCRQLSWYDKHELVRAIL